MSCHAPPGLESSSYRYGIHCLFLMVLGGDEEGSAVNVRALDRRGLFRGT